MCGIAGYMSHGLLTPDDIAVVETMGTMLTHGGPDGSGQFTDRHLAMSMRRLSIIDLQGAQEPLFNEDGSLVLVANGEIYNYLELRSCLAGRGHRLIPQGGCETVLHLYEEHGLEFVHHLRGMFAFALWDAKARRLILGRDRYGREAALPLRAAREHPLRVGDESTPALRTSPVRARSDRGRSRLSLQYVPDPWTPLKGVRKLPAASLLIIDLDDWQVAEKTYWRMEDAPLIERDPADAVRSWKMLVN